MIKHIPEDLSVVFEEIPDEITLAFNISNCCNHCEGCHSPYLRKDIGEELTTQKLDEYISLNPGITCICFMGEGNDQKTLIDLASHIRTYYGYKYKIALYSGRDSILEDEFWDVFDYIKIGAYKKEYGPLNEKTTNQRLYFGGPYFSWCTVIDNVTRYGWKDITYKFWK